MKDFTKGIIASAIVVGLCRIFYKKGRVDEFNKIDQMRDIVNDVLKDAKEES